MIADIIRKTFIVVRGGRCWSRIKQIDGQSRGYLLLPSHDLTLNHTVLSYLESYMDYKGFNKVTVVCLDHYQTSMNKVSFITCRAGEMKLLVEYAELVNVDVIIGSLNEPQCRKELINRLVLDSFSIDSLIKYVVYGLNLEKKEIVLVEK